MVTNLEENILTHTFPGLTPLSPLSRERGGNQKGGESVKISLFNCYLNCEEMDCRQAGLLTGHIKNWLPSPTVSELRR
jgi:hypothetical protein